MSYGRFRAQSRLRSLSCFTFRTLIRRILYFRCLNALKVLAGCDQLEQLLIAGRYHACQAFVSVGVGIAAAFDHAGRDAVVQKSLHLMMIGRSLAEENHYSIARLYSFFSYVHGRSGSQYGPCLHPLCSEFRMVYLIRQARGKACHVDRP